MLLNHMLTSAGRSLIGLMAIVPTFIVVGFLNYFSRKRAEATKPNGDVVVCRPASGWALLAALMGVGMIVGSVFLAVRAGHLNDAPRGLVLALVSLGAFAFGYYFILAILKYRVVLRPDSITLLGILRDKSLRVCPETSDRIAKFSEHEPD
jgi:hypothetical protein